MLARRLGGILWKLPTRPVPGGIGATIGHVPCCARPLVLTGLVHLRTTTALHCGGVALSDRASQRKTLLPAPFPATTMDR